jgi:hypothetical protein
VVGISISQFLTLYNWFLVAAILLFILLIARFYQKTVEEPTYFLWFIVPVLLFGGATMRYAAIDRLAGDVIGDVLFGAGGLTLVIHMSFLYWRMTRNR